MHVYGVIVLFEIYSVYTFHVPRWASSYDGRIVQLYHVSLCFESEKKTSASWTQGMTRDYFNDARAYKKHAIVSS